MRTIRRSILAFLLISCAFARAEDSAADLEGLGVDALKRSQEAPDEIISATLFFGQAALAYEKAKNEEKVRDMNGYLFWCKKKMSLQQMEQFLKTKEPSAAIVAKRLAEVEKTAKPADAQTYFDRAEAFAKANPEEPLLIAIRFFEVADRFKGTEVSLAAQDRSLQAMTQAAQKKVAAPAAPAPAAEAPEAPKKEPVPPAEKLAEVDKTLRDLFADDFKKTASTDKAALARKLVQIADGSNDPAEKYGTLLQAATAAAQGGDLSFFLDLHDKIDETFEANPQNLKKAGLVALLAATNDAAVIKAATALKTLAEKSDDPLANTNAGKYLVFVRGDWERGMPLFTKGNIPELKNAAVLDAAGPQEPAAQAAAGDAWWNVGEKTTDKEEKRQLQDRAAYWYRKAAPGLNGLEKVKAEKRLASADPTFRPSPRTTANVAVPGVAAAPGVPMDAKRAAGTWKIAYNHRGSTGEVVNELAPDGTIRVGKDKKGTWSIENDKLVMITGSKVTCRFVDVDTFEGAAEDGGKRVGKRIK